MLGGIGSNIAVGVSLVMNDRLTATARTASASIGSLHSTIRTAQKNELEHARNINAAGAAMGMTAIMVGREWYKTGAKFDHTMKFISTVAEEKGGVSMDMLAKKIKRVGEETMFTNQEIASGAQYMGMAGLDTRTIYNSIEAVAQLAAATNHFVGGVGGTADIATNIIKGFGLDATEEQMSRVADILTTAVTSANINMTQLMESLKYGMPTAVNLGASLEEMSALIMMLGDAGLQGSMAGIGIENMFRYISRAADEARSGKQGDALAKIGLSPKDLKDSEGNLLSMSQILKVMSTGLRRMGNSDMQNALNDIFQVRGGRAASIILRDLDNLDAAVDRLSNKSQGRARRNSEKLMQSMWGMMEKLRGTIDSLITAFSEALAPAINATIRVFIPLIKAVTTFVETPIGKFTTVAISGLVVMTTTLLGLRAALYSVNLMMYRLAENYAALGGAFIRGKGGTGGSRGFGMGSLLLSLFGLGGMRSRGGLSAREMKRGREIIKARRKVTEAAYATAGFYPTDNKTGAKWRDKKGRYASGLHATSMSAAFGRKWYTGLGGKIGTGLGKVGRGLGNPIGIMGGLGLSTLGELAGTDKALGKGLSIAGSTLTWASTGAMMGSMFGPLGTGVGALVGAAGGLIGGILTHMKKAEEVIEDGTSKLNSKLSYDKNELKGVIDRLLSMKYGDTLFGIGKLGTNYNQYYGSDADTIKDFLANRDRNNPVPIQLTIHVNGAKTYNNTTTDSLTHILNLE